MVDAPVSPIATQPFWVVERVLYLDGWEKGRPVYVMNGLRPDDHAYSQDIEHAKQFPTKDDAAAYLRDNLRDNEAFEIHEHMMVAPPTATQETPEQMADWIVERCPLPVNDTIGRGWLRKAVADTVKDALSSAERRIEELGRDLGARERRIEELEIERANARESEAYATDCFREAHTALGAAESRLASLTGQVEDMRERAAKEARDAADFVEKARAALIAKAATEDVPDYTEKHHSLFCGAALALDIEAAIRSLPVLPTTGDGGGWRSMDSAPKDGTSILVYSRPYARIVMARWSTWSGGAYWMQFGSGEVFPTHWMPLPRPPVEPEEDRT